MLLRRGSRASFDFGQSRAGSAAAAARAARAAAARSVSLDLRGKEVPQIRNSPLLCLNHRKAMSQVIIPQLAHLYLVYVGKVYP